LQLDEIPDLKIGFTRFIGGMVMHVLVSEEIQNGLKMMKYSSNHWWKFKNARLAWFSGLLQVTALLLVAFVNYFVVAISADVLELAKDFTALMIIGEFDDKMSGISEIYAGNEEISLEVIDEQEKDYFDMLKIEVTTSNRLNEGRANFRMEKDEVFEKINERRTLAGKPALIRPKSVHVGNMWQKSFYEERPFYS